MTFNTTSLPLWRALGNKRLLEREPRKPLGDPKRHLLVTPEVDQLLDGRIHYGIFPAVSAEKLIGVFSAGQLVTVSRQLTKRKPDVEQIVGHDEVWALCFRKPIPGWRLLGRWYEKDVFVAFRPWDKKRLFGKYKEASQEVIEDWKELFSDRPPHQGQNVSDYLSGVFRDVDEVI